MNFKASEGSCTPDLNPVIKPADGLHVATSFGQNPIDFTAAIATMLRRRYNSFGLEVNLNKFWKKFNIMIKH